MSYPRRLLIFILLFALASCYTAPVLVRTDTTQEQESAKQAATDLAKVRNNKQNVIAPTDQAAIVIGEKTLNACAASQAKLTKQVNDLGAELEKCKAAYVQSQEDGGSWLTRFKRFYKEIVACIVSFGIGTAFGRLILSMLWGAIQAAVPALRRPPV